MALPDTVTAKRIHAAGVKTAAAWSGIDPSTIHKWIRTHRIQVIRLNGKRMVILEEVEEQVNRERKRGRTPKSSTHSKLGRNPDGTPAV